MDLRVAIQVLFAVGMVGADDLETGNKKAARKCAPCVDYAGVPYGAKGHLRRGFHQGLYAKSYGLPYHPINPSFDPSAYGPNAGPYYGDSVPPYGQFAGPQFVRPPVIGSSVVPPSYQSGEGYRLPGPGLFGGLGQQPPLYGGFGLFGDPSAFKGYTTTESTATTTKSYPIISLYGQVAPYSFKAGYGSSNQPSWSSYSSSNPSYQFSKSSGGLSPDYYALISSIKSGSSPSSSYGFKSGGSYSGYQPSIYGSYSKGQGGTSYGYYGTAGGSSSSYGNSYGSSYGSPSYYGSSGYGGYSGSQSSQDPAAALAQQAADQAKAAKEAQSNAAALAAQKAAAKLAEQAAEAAKQAAAVLSAKQQQTSQVQQAAQDAQAAAEAEASLAAQISSAVETAQQSQSQSDAVSQSINKLVTVSSQSADAPKKTLEKLQAIQAVQNQMAYEAHKNAFQRGQEQQATFADLIATQQAVDKAAAAAAAALAGVSASSGSPSYAYYYGDQATTTTASSSSYR